MIVLVSKSNTKNLNQGLTILIVVLKPGPNLDLKCLVILGLNSELHQSLIYYWLMLHSTVAGRQGSS